MNQRDQRDSLLHPSPTAAAEEVQALVARGLLDHRQGRHAQAITGLNRALSLAPDLAAIHVALAEAHRAGGEFAQAERHYRRVVELQPDAAAFVNLGNTQMQVQRPREAAESYSSALRRNSRLWEAYYGLGAALAAQGIAEAGDAFGRAAALQPEFAPAHEGLIDACIDAGAWGAALQASSAALMLTGSPRLRVQYVDSVVNVDLAAEVPGLRAAMQRALDERWTRPQALARAACDIVMLHRPLSTDDPLIRSLLDLAPICHPDIELWLTALRQAALETVARGDELTPEAHDIACRLARQCFINEYAWPCTPEESAAVEALRSQIEAALDRGTLPSRSCVAAVSLYLPLSALNKAGELLSLSDGGEFESLLTQQISEPAEEFRLRDSIPESTTIEDETSQRVQDQYEANPYPRWMSMANFAAPVPLGVWLTGRFPGAPLLPLALDRTLDVLVAGCGTGQQALETARGFAGMRVLAIDLSMASLAYAARMTAKLGVDGVDYAQLDLLSAASLERSFDMIAAGGVLHHMSDPWAGWRALLGCLRPSGVMNILVYTERGRTDVRAARDWIAARGYPATPNGIRTFRQALMALSDGWAKRLAASPDFNSISGCRDLLFHVQEQALTLPDIADFLAAENVTLLGVEVAPATEQAFLSSTHGNCDGAPRDLACWDLFEAEHPRCFAGMINLWLQGPPSP